MQARRDTRGLILATSLELFNEFGAPNVSTNHIADEADISPGNLYYHFKSKGDIVLELFKRFIGELQPLIDVPENTSLEAQDLWFQLHMTFELKGRFRFVYRNLADLTAEVPGLEKACRGLMLRERAAVVNLLGGLEHRGAMAFQPHEKELLVSNILLTLNYWIPFAEVFEPDSVDDGTAVTFAIARVLQMVSPFLREPERSEFENLVVAYLA